VNPAAVRAFGYSAEEIEGQPLDLLLVAGGDAFRDVQAIEPHRTIEREGRRKNGEVFPVDVTVFQFETPGGLRWAVNALDVSERRAVEKLKQEFVSTVSHELRTPLTSIRGSLGLLHAGALGELPDEANDVVALAERNTVRLITLINDILDLERLESGRLELHVAIEPVEPVLRRAVDAVHAFAGEHGVTVTVEAEPLQVRMDADRVVQVLVNLISNAVKFSHRGSAVEIVARAAGGWAEVRVVDYGRGIPASHREAVFERFKQVESSDARREGGTGLGLAICRSIVERHGGTIGVDSVEGKGSTFWFRLPLTGATNA
jgi:PAS domain S-box-containing protein